MKGATIGAGLGFVLGSGFLLLAPYAAALNDFVYANLLARLFLASSNILAVVTIGTPALIANILLGLLVFAPLVVGGAFTGVFAQRKEYFWMTMTLLLVAGVLAITASLAL